MDIKKRKSIDELASAVSKIVGIPKNMDLEDSLEHIGIDIRYFNNKTYDAFLEWDSDNDCPIIAVNAEQPLTRRNFSMAHELGHLIINYGWIPLGNNENFDNKGILSIKYRGGNYKNYTEQQDEYVMNEFAASFLIPNYFLKDLISKQEKLDYFKLINKLSSDFKVSVEAAKIRLDNFLEME